MLTVVEEMSFNKFCDQEICHVFKAVKGLKESELYYKAYLNHDYLLSQMS